MINNIDISQLREIPIRWIKEPHSWVGHLPFAYWLISILKPARIVELGTHTGNSFFAFCQSMKEHNVPGECHAVDSWEGDEHAGFYGEEIYQMVSKHAAQEYPSTAKLSRMLFEQAVAQFNPRSIDLLHIDGLHTYEAVKHDFETWLPCLAEGGVVLFHDIAVQAEGFGVHRFWKELVNHYRHHLSFAHSNGLGVLQPTPHPRIGWYSWLEPGCEEQELLCRYFSAAGSALYELHEKKRFEKLLNELQTERDALYSERNLLLSKLDSIQSSLSWKFTAPCRKIQRFLQGRLKNNLM